MIFSIVKEYFLAKMRMRFTPKNLQKWQKKRLRKMRRFVQKNSPYFQKERGVIEKDDFMKHFDEINTLGIEKEEAFAVAIQAEKDKTLSEIKGITIGLSSGTSGSRGLFLASEKERAFWAGNVLARTLPKSIFRKQKIAFFLRANSKLYETVKSKRLDFRYFDLEKSMEEHVQELEKFSPDLLVAPASMLRLLAMQKISISPQKIISVAEVLESVDQECIEKHFQRRVDQVYQCTEGFLAFTCKEGNIHLNEDLLLFEKEYLSKKRFIPILTDFFRTSQPIIRYRLNDILIEKEGACSCGCPFQMIEKIEGRIDDIFFQESLSGDLKTLFPDFIRRKIIIHCPEIEEYRVVQKASDFWEIAIRPFHHEMITKVRKAMTELLEERNLAIPHFGFQKAETKAVRGEKMRRICSMRKRNSSSVSN